MSIACRGQRCYAWSLRFTYAPVWPTSHFVHFVLKTSQYTRFICRDCRFAHQNDIETDRFCLVVDVFSVTPVVLWDTLFTPYQQTVDTGRLVQHLYVLLCCTCPFLYSYIVNFLLYMIFLSLHSVDRVLFCSHLPTCLSSLGVVVFVSLTFSSYLLVALILVFLLQLYLTALLSVFRFITNTSNLS